MKTIYFSLLKSGEMLSAVPKNSQFKEIFTKQIIHTFW